VAREPSTASRRARGRVAGAAAPKLRLAEGEFLTDGRKLVEVHRVVLHAPLDEKGHSVPDCAERRVLVTNASASLEAPADFLTLTDEDLRGGWRNVTCVPYDGTEWEEYVG